jgi:hypothetical protein
MFRRKELPVNKPSESVEHISASELHTTTMPLQRNSTFFNAVSGKADIGSGVGSLHLNDRCKVVMLLTYLAPATIHSSGEVANDCHLLRPAKPAVLTTRLKMLKAAKQSALFLPPRLRLHPRRGTTL